MKLDFSQLYTIANTRFLPLTLRFHRILLNTLYIMIPMHMQSLKLLRPTA